MWLYLLVIIIGIERINFWYPTKDVAMEDYEEACNDPKVSDAKLYARLADIDGYKYNRDVLCQALNGTLKFKTTELIRHNSKD